ncbi:DNA double-strand break repair nuclease NurA [Methanococcoides burtonii]|uniref:NurA domain-containing protein n=1 Tax=Methanococcoides burtonii (strain DSM 6242 / NBRC 107633 / OCM 468 / ACE-M) TaxID=259564 RepID=Q12U58_METBU|nr:DNA double-strand break repair nuclease NurA [Methanococcoides burtonii]ABE53018.1 Hypothetical protein Mbur_2148 [Methanococcoides burtonii DSM 6242]
MTLEPVHIKIMSEMADRIGMSAEDDSTDEFPDLLNILNELEHDGKLILRSLGKTFRSKVNIDNMSLTNDPFDITYSCDSGSTNPMAFRSGLYVDICHGGIASTPSDLELHSKRTIVAATYSPSPLVTIDTTSGWDTFDEGQGRSKIVRIGADLLKTRVDRMVHNVALYLCESEHILWMMESFDSKGFFIMDGPIYPKQLMYWMVVESKEVRIKEDPVAKNILQNYIDIMDYQMKKGMPLIGFVKNPEDMQIMITLRDKKGMKHLPWLRDSQFFKNVLSLGNGDNGRNGRWITYTNWFLQPNQFYEGMINSTSPMLDIDLRHDLDPEDYAITFFMLYVPMLDVLFKVEAPYGFTKDESVRDLITRKVLFDISVNGIPLTLSKVDSLAKIGRSEKELIKGMFKGQRFDNTYNIERWGDLTDE